MTNNYVVTDSTGAPTGSIDLDVITDAATKLAFRLAAACQDPEAVESIASIVLRQHGPAAFGYIAASALSVMTTEILAPCLKVTQAHGTNLRPGLQAVADEQNPAGA